MKLQEAIDIGKECGLETQAECVNNILIHDLNLFVYSDIEKQLTELRIDAAAHGIKFCSECGAAKIDDGCYLCKKFEKIAG